jgi:hypothetical protein
MAAKKKPAAPAKKPGRKRPRCVVCLEGPQQEWSLCGKCDMDYAIALAEGMGSIAWAAGRARLFAIKRRSKK